MKDITIKNIPKDAIYKDVVIIGNGPSGISLSYMLDGNWPYWNNEKIEKHPDELLRARLNYADNGKSLVEQDLVTLADGLEGRSTNPISLLLDSLEHPCADLGMELPSMLEYRNHQNAQIDHIVLGKGPPGGSWHKMDPNLRTLSLASWMSLPGLSFNDWEKQQIAKIFEDKTNGKTLNIDNDNNKKQMNPPQQHSTTTTTTQNSSPCHKCMELRNKQKNKLINEQRIINNNDSISLMNNNESESGALCCKCTKTLTINGKCSEVLEPKDKINEKFLLNSSGILPPRRNLSLKRQVSKEVQTRALVSRVAEYYEDYVYLMGLDKYFVNDAVVTLIVPLQEGSGQGKYKSARWLVMGVNKLTGRQFYYACANVVLANGASDLANRLGLKGENLNVSWVKHELPQLEAALESLTDIQRSKLKPVLVVGAGLSAADAVTICRSSDIPVIHVFRSRTAGLDKMLPENVYPEYHEVQRMMKDPNNVYDFYLPVPEHTISDLNTNPDGTHTVTVQNLNNGETTTFEVSYCAILIGSKPDLRFASPLTLKCPVKPVTITTSLVNDKLSNNLEALTNSSLSKKISWLKTLCAKCKHLNLCERSRRAEYRKMCGQTYSTNNGDKDVMNVCTIEGSGLGLGEDPTKPIDCKSNQIAVDKYSNAVLQAPKGLYAMGPLVGDNFVRFIPGGALAITAALNREND